MINDRQHESVDESANEDLHNNEDISWCLLLSLVVMDDAPNPAEIINFIISNNQSKELKS